MGFLGVVRPTPISPIQMVRRMSGVSLSRYEFWYTVRLGFAAFFQAAVPADSAATMAATCRSDAFGEDANSRPKSRAKASGKMSS